MELKKWSSFDEQANLLIDKNIIVADIEDCKNFLAQTNYYRLSGYYLPFIHRGQDKCFMEVPFERIKAIYFFDANLRNLIFKVIAEIEVCIRTQLSYYHGKVYGPEGYKSESAFNSRHDHYAFIDHLNLCIKENANTLIVKHHNRQYDGHFPIWVMIDFFSLGMLTHFYSDMLNRDKSNISKAMFEVNYQIMENWLHCLNDLRNKCAHYARLYYWKFPTLPKMPPTDSYVPTRRLFAQIYMLKHMYPNSLNWDSDFVEPLKRLVDDNKFKISLKHLDFPENWEEMLKK